MSARIAVTLLWGWLLMSGCSGSVDLDISGTVSAAEDGAPLAGQVVVLLYETGLYSVDAVGTESGADGRYRLILLQFPCDGGPTLAAGGGAWQTEEKDVRCIAAPQQVDFALSR